MNRDQDIIMALKRSIIELENQGLSAMVVKHEDGSGSSFNLRGYCKIKKRGEFFSTCFKAYYNAKTRKGKISFS
jgi:hypothetical protein